MTVYKYELPYLDRFTLDLPKGAQLLTVAEQRGVVYLWALVDPDAQRVDRAFRLAGTGHLISTEDAERYVGTAHYKGGALVFHLFDGGEQ